MRVTTADPLACSLGWGHEQVHLSDGPKVGLEAAVVAHSTALGGLRIRPYPGGLAEALDDALRLVGYYPSALAQDRYKDGAS